MQKSYMQPMQEFQGVALIRGVLTLSTVWIEISVHSLASSTCENLAEKRKEKKKIYD